MEGTRDNKTRMAPPWVQYANAVKAMFREDPEVEVVYDDQVKLVKLMVNNPSKAEALEKLLEFEKDFGGTKLTLMVVPANSEKTTRDLIRWALAGNRAVSRVVNVEDAFSNPLTYIAFKKEVVQYYNDNLGDLYGNRNTLYETLAGEIFPKHEGVLFCTEAKEKEE